MGFRPYIYRLAHRHHLAGWVRNTSAGVMVEVEGDALHIDAFLQRLPREAPPAAHISSLSARNVPLLEESRFIIADSSDGPSSALVAPDRDVCPACLRELFDPSDRRYRYPFINCTDCGPRYSLISATPYDRINTTMNDFPLCDLCLAEFEDPGSRRFHAQPNACPDCGPKLRLLDRHCNLISTDNPIELAVHLLRQGKILALKGAGGFHLAVDPENHQAVQELRRRKRRDEKPLALMAPSLSSVASFAEMDAVERRSLVSSASPIVLLRKKGWFFSPLVAPGNGCYGVMLPSTPLHHLLLRDNFTALVMTSGNTSGEPIVHHDREALDKLSDIADCFLTHDRRIETRIDDSVVRVIMGHPVFLRRSRGYVPQAVILPDRQQSVLALGGDLKGAICLTRDNHGYLSQHLGDLKNATTLESFGEVIGHLRRLLGIEPEIVAHDLHPDYLSTIYAEKFSGLPRVPVQHHHAHMASCLAEHGTQEPALGVVFDGTGYGPDGTIWGGEFLIGDCGGFERKGCLKPTAMPGGDTAAKEPYRMAFSYLYETHGRESLSLPLHCFASLPEEDKSLLHTMMNRRVNSPLTSSCGRLFDAVAAILGIRNMVTFEGQAALELEGLADGLSPVSHYRHKITESEGLFQIDFGNMVNEIVEDTLAGVDKHSIARAFHLTVARATAELCSQIGAQSGIRTVVLSGGVFQNRILTEDTALLLAAAGFQVLTHRLVPPNDGGLALGQAVIAPRQLRV